MPTTPPYRYGSPETRVANRLDEIQVDAPVEFDTFVEIANELQELRNQIAALQGGTPEISFLLME